MGNKEIILNLPTNYREEFLRERIKEELKIKEFSYQIKNKSLDARKKNNIHWQIRISVFSSELKGEAPVPLPSLNIPFRKRNQKVLVVGNGPAGFFSAYILQKAGYDVTMIERGADITKRAKGIKIFEKTSKFDSVCNYPFGEGGAGTFSDGKLTARSKHISKEKQFILSTYIDAGAPEEIQYLAHPHLGSDRLKVLVRRLREMFQSIGGTVLFETYLEDLKIKNGKVTEALTSIGTIDADVFFIASGHSAYDTYRMLINKGIRFRPKNFAIGHRIEHLQEIINKAQWSRSRLPGVKAAEYRLTSKGDGVHNVYTFCMCPGGVIVPAMAYKNTSVVNGMSLYNRDDKFANAACVVGTNLNELLGREISALEALDWLEKLEQNFYDYSNSYQIPYCSIQDYISKKEPSKIAESSYPLGIKPAPLWEMLPSVVRNAIRVALKDFSRRIYGFETGNIMGLESKTSAPVQVLREKNGVCTGFENLYMVGECSGYAGGIVSCAADGIKAAMGIV